MIKLCQELFTIKAPIAEVVINPRDTQNSYFLSGHISLTVDGYMFGSLELLTFEGGDRDHADTFEHDFKVNSGGNFSLSSRQCLSDVCVSPGSLMPWQRLNLHIPDLACPGSHELRIHVHLERAVLGAGQRCSPLPQTYGKSAGMIGGRGGHFCDIRFWSVRVALPLSAQNHGSIGRSSEPAKGAARSPRRMESQPA